MTGSRAAALIAVAAFAGLAATAAVAQFGTYTLPKSDFVWNWGDPERTGARFEDFSVSGGEGGFLCELKGKMTAFANTSPSDARALEDTLRARLDFIYASSTYMNQLQEQRQLEWARLACSKQQSAPLTEQEKADREAKAREKMQREVDRRRQQQPRPQQP